MCYFQQHASTETTGSPRGSIPPQVTDSLLKAALLESCLPFNLPSLAQSITAQGLLTGIQGEPKVSSAAGCMMAGSCYVLERKVALYHLEDMRGGLLCAHSAEGSESLCSLPPHSRLIFMLTSWQETKILPMQKKKLFFKLLGLFYLKQIHLSFF